MGSQIYSASRSATDTRRAALLGTLLFVALAVAALAWSKWLPYVEKLHVTIASGAFPGHDLLAEAGAAGSSPSPARALTFTKVYVLDIWPALLAALVMSAGIDALVPRRWMLRALGDRGSLPSRVRAGVLAMPCMMCTCCSAPLVFTMRRRGVPAATALSYWLANPLLNPVVLAFLAIVLPWQWVATRAAIGALLVFALTGTIVRLAGGERRIAGQTAPDDDTQIAGQTAPGGASREAERALGADETPVARRFALTLVRLTVTLVPEYLVAVFAVGLLRGWLLPVGDGATHLTLIFTVVAAVAGTLVVIPTAGEIPLIGALLAAGVGAGPLGALLVTLPAISLPSIAMTGRAIGWRISAITAAAVAVAGMLSGALLWALGG